jgi:hypothetical protein
MFDEMAHSHGWIASGETVAKWGQSQSESAFGFWIFFFSGDISLIFNLNNLRCYKHCREFPRFFFCLYSKVPS